MSQAIVNGSSISYIYNALGQLIEKSGNGGTTLLMYDEAGHVLGEYTSAGALIEETIWMGDTPVATLLPNGSGISIYYVHTDHLGTPRKITRPSDNGLMWRWDPDIFGSLAPNTNPSGLGTFTYNLRFPGQYALSESGLFYNHARDYDPVTGRYIESDPIGLGGGVNSYAYAGANPLSAFDASGLSCVAMGSMVTCSYPGGPTVRFPRPIGWPDQINDGSSGYHKYDVPVQTSCPADSMANAIAQNPTPGTPAPASAAGTPNDATPDAGRGLFAGGFFGSPSLNISPVISYLTADINTGAPVVVNVTQPGHPLWPGYVARTVSATSSGSIVNNYGEGTAVLQSVGSPVAGLIDDAWIPQTKRLARSPSCGCGK
jgi:RHS repeat-associated protein